VKIQNNVVGVIELSNELDIETVTEIFIRVNSQGAQLSQAEQAKAELMKSRPELNNDMITIGKVWIDRSFWVDGFFTYEWVNQSER
jgi:uncharacterized protein with ParB-like and HNH nuclease domain